MGLGRKWIPERLLLGAFGTGVSCRYERAEGHELRTSRNSRGVQRLEQKPVVCAVGLQLSFTPLRGP